MGFPVRYSDFKIQNVVASADAKFPIHLEKLEIDHISRKVDTSEIQFMPELFPGLVYRLKSPKMAFLIFVSGKIVITGAKSFKEIGESFEQMYRLVHRFRKLQHNWSCDSLLRCGRDGKELSEVSQLPGMDV